MIEVLLVSVVFAACLAAGLAILWRMLVSLDRWLRRNERREAPDDKRERRAAHIIELPFMGSGGVHHGAAADKSGGGEGADASEGLDFDFLP